MAPKQRSSMAYPGRESPHVDILLDNDLQEPLMAQTEGEDTIDVGGASRYAAAASAAAAAAEPPVVVQPVGVPHIPWPALRRSSVSVRKVSPVAGFDPNEVRELYKI
jgi:hypothetical protein